MKFDVSEGYIVLDVSNQSSAVFVSSVLSDWGVS